MSSSVMATLTSAMSSPSSTTPTSASSSLTGLPQVTGTGQQDQNTGGGGSKQLLFFVALGFGVVFTNLWVIVGVKYCFRYNRRARAGLLNDDSTEPIGLGTLPGHRIRRRREKKLMTMDEVNERFPLTRYKTWKSAREQQGLAPEGGVTAPHSRATSLHDGEVVAGVEETQVQQDAPPHTEPARAKTSTEAIRPVADDTIATKDFEAQDKSSAEKKAQVNVTESPAEKTPAVEHREYYDRSQTSDVDADEDERDPINDPIHSSMPDFRPEDAPAGDSCAICIDALEDDDEVRGLTCGHAFHAGCLDPWLTGRRACCPLCKADYYVPKPAGGSNSEGGTVSGIPGSSAPAVVGMRRSTRTRSGMLTLARPVYVGRNPGLIFGGRANPVRPARTDDAATASETATDAQQADQTAPRNPDGRAARALHWFRTVPDRLPGMGNRQNNSNDQQATPGQLEAGQQTTASTTTPERTT